MDFNVAKVSIACYKDVTNLLKSLFHKCLRNLHHRYHFFNRYDRFFQRFCTFVSPNFAKIAQLVEH